MHNADLVAEGLTVEYWMRNQQRKVLAVQNASFAVNAGEFVAILGPSGCGKTTILNVTAGLVNPTGGRILLGGREIFGPGRDRAMVFQSPALMPWRTVVQNVSYGLELQGLEKPERENRANEFLELVGLSGFGESFPHELSGGMQQRVNLARALTLEPALLLLDEPLASLDAQTREYMQAELQQIWMTLRNTALFVTHQISEAVFLADRVIVMSPRPGKIKEVIRVSLPRPRKLDEKRSSEFLEIEDHIWNLLQEDRSALLAA